MAKEKMIKSTINISASNYEKLKCLVASNLISSMTDGINIGIDLLIKEKEKEEYEKMMSEAMNDKDFVERTIKVGKEFDLIEGEAPGEW